MPDETMTECRYCGGDHLWERCWRILAIEYRTDGSYRVELGTRRGPMLHEAQAAGNAGNRQQRRHVEAPAVAAGIQARRVVLTPEQVAQVRSQPSVRVTRPPR